MSGDRGIGGAEQRLHGECCAVGHHKNIMGRRGKANKSSELTPKETRYAKRKPTEFIVVFRKKLKMYGKTSYKNLKRIIKICVPVRVRKILNIWRNT